jgi:hypothetical protein
MNRLEVYMGDSLDRLLAIEEKREQGAEQSLDLRRGQALSDTAFKVLRSKRRRLGREYVCEA